MHGLSLNVCPDMRYFDNIVPCGITDKAVGSLSSMNTKATINSVSTVLLNQFADVFNVEYISCQENTGNSVGDKSYNAADDTFLFRYLESIT
jgi:lipoyl(octanoyl) transferase